MDFGKDDVFAYNQINKKIFGYASIVIILSLIFVVFHYFAFLRGSNNVTVQLVENLFQHFVDHMSSSSLLGAFYGGAIGGLFFIYLPLEVLYLNFLRTGMHPLSLGLLFLSGIFISFSINYFVGYFFADISKELIGAKKFYKLKVVLNNYGGLAIFFFNATPMPAQPLAVILGVFRYDKTRFYIYVFLGQLTKVLAMSISFIYFSNTLI